MPNNDQNLARFFREAAPYIHMHRGETFVIALSGEILQHKKAGEVLGDIAILSSLGAQIVLVHGARPQINQQLVRHNHQVKIHNGLRITDERTLEISKAAIGSARLEIENHLNRALNRPPIINRSLGIVSGNFLTAKPLGIIDGVDYIHTGKVRKVNSKLLEQLLNSGNIALVSPLGYSPTGQIYNIRYEEIASHLADKLDADKLIFLHTNSERLKLPRHCTLKHLDEHLKAIDNTLLNEISKAMHGGVERAHLIDIDNHGSVLLELYTRDGVGSMLSTGRYDETRQAEINDIGGIIELIKPLEIQGTLAKRNREQLELDINHFSVIERDGLIIGCAALYPVKNTNIGELSCLAIHEDYRSDNRGAAIVESIRQKACKIGLNNLFVLTTQSTDWFLEQGFEERPISALPEQRRRSYNANRNSKVLFLAINP